MLSFLFVVAYLFFPILIALLYRRSGINIFKPSIISVFFWSYLCFAYIGTLPLYFYWNDYYYILGVQERFQILKLWYYSSMSLFLITLTIIVLKNFFRTSFNIYIDNEKQIKNSFFILIILSVCVVVFLNYASKIPTIPLLALLSGASTYEVKVLRSLATNNFSGDYHWFSLFFDKIATFITYVSFANYLKNKNASSFSIFFISFLITSFFALSTTQKAPFVWFIIGLVIVYLITKNVSIRPKYILIFFVISIPSLVLMYRSIMGMEDRSLGEVITAIISRTFTGQISAAYFYLEIFPDQHDFLLGKSLPNPKGIFPWEHYNITVEVMNYISPSLAEKNIVGSAPTVFWAEMYANFAVGGIIISSILVGSALFFIQLVILRLPMNPIIVGMYTWIILYLKNLTLTGLSTFIINIDFVVVLFVGILLSIVTGCTSKKLSIRINN